MKSRGDSEKCGVFGPFCRVFGKAFHPYPPKQTSQLSSTRVPFPFPTHTTTTASLRSMPLTGTPGSTVFSVDPHPHLPPSISRSGQNTNTYFNSSSSASQMTSAPSSSVAGPPSGSDSGPAGTPTGDGGSLNTSQTLNSPYLSTITAHASTGSSVESYPSQTSPPYIVDPRPSLSPSSSQTPSNPHGGLRTGAIIGITIVVFSAVLCVVGGLFLLFRRARRRKKRRSTESGWHRLKPYLYDGAFRSFCYPSPHGNIC